MKLPCLGMGQISVPVATHASYVQRLIGSTALTTETHQHYYRHPPFLCDSTEEQHENYIFRSPAFIFCFYSLHFVCTYLETANSDHVRK